MLEAFKIFDAYDIRARLFPALLAGLPSLALLIVLVPWDRLGLPHAIAVTMATVLLFAFADVARKLGHKVEAKLESRSTPEIMFRGDPAVDEVSKDRYRGFLAKKLNKPAPTEAEELTNPAEARSFYLSAGNWLRQETRDKKNFYILASELVTYGFRRNLLGLRPISLTLNVVVLSVCVAAFYAQPAYLESIKDSQPKLLMVSVAALLHSIYMMLAVNKTSVLQASRVYGRELIVSCEALIKVGKTASSKPEAGKMVS